LLRKIIVPIFPPDRGNPLLFLRINNPKEGWRLSLKP